MDFGVLMFFTDYAISAGDLAKALEERGLGTRALAHTDFAQDTVSGRRRAAEALLRRDGPVRLADRRCDRDHQAQGRHRRVPGAAARPDPDGQARRLG